MKQQLGENKKDENGNLRSLYYVSSKKEEVIGKFTDDPLLISLSVSKHKKFAFFKQKFSEDPVIEKDSRKETAHTQSNFNLF